MRLRHILVAAAAMLSVSPAWGQAIVQAGGANPTLTSMGQNILSICPSLVGRRNAGQSANPDEVDLSFRCTSAVATANSGNLAGTAGVLSQLAGIQTLGQDAAISGATTDQSRAIASRVSALRGGIGGAAGLNLVSMSSLAQADGAGSSGIGRGRGFDLWGTGSYTDGERDASALEFGYEVEGWSAIVGGDYFLTDALSIGAAIGYSSSEAKFAANGGGLETDTWTVGAYAATTFANDVSVSIYGAVDFLSIDSERRIQYTETLPAATVVNRLARGSTDGRQYEVSATVARTYALGTFDVAPIVEVSYARLDIDGFTEGGAQGLDLVFSDQETDSLLINLGVDASRRASTSYGVVSPYLRARYSYEALDDARAVSANYRADPFVNGATNVAGANVRSAGIRIQSDEPDRHRFIFGAGIQAQFAAGFSAFLDYETVLGLEDVTLNTVAIGFRKEF